MTPQELTLWAFALIILAVAIACTIVVGYVTFKVLCAIKEKGLQAIVDWFVCWVFIRINNGRHFRDYVHI